MAKNILLTVDALHYAPEATEMAKELCQGPDRQPAAMTLLIASGAAAIYSVAL